MDNVLSSFSQRSIIDLSFYLKEGNYLEKPNEDSATR